MIKRHERLYAVCDEFVEKPVVEIQTFRIWLAGSVRKNPGPGNRKPIGLCAQRLHQLNVLLVAAIAVARLIGIAAVGDVAGDVSVTVPDRWTSSVFVDRAFDLIGRRRSPPDKSTGKFWRGGFTARSSARGPWNVRRYSERQRNPRPIAPGKIVERHGAPLSQRIPAVIARSTCDEAIQSCFAILDCFA